MLHMCVPRKARFCPRRPQMLKFICMFLRINLSIVRWALSTNAHPPELKKYMDKKLSLRLNGSQVITGILRGFDPFMNLVLDETVEETKGGEKHDIGMVVVRGNSIPGDRVWVWTPIRLRGLSEKLLRRYFGPYKALRRLGDLNYEVLPDGTRPSRRRQPRPEVVHVVRLKPYYER
ncbi:hypothetical protein HPB47_019520 [Ixodes persulcatus]|uniref:Uncharacterized protein n=1 Tax=Ixodes persulcatus TaxID=34615 RepID=A0AC60QHY5_IXOPE|nr:hypothetical protein HPB47_019520 [Ixodes persulcatus]